MQRIAAYWQRVKAWVGGIWQKPLDAFLLLIGLILFIVLCLVLFNDWVKSQAIVFLVVGNRWEIIKFISLGITVILGLWVLVAGGKSVVALVENDTKEAENLRERIVIRFLLLVGVLGLGLLILLIAVIFFAGIEGWTTRILGTSDDINKQDVIKFIGWGIAGILAFFGAVAVNRRANAQLRDAAAQVENNKLIEKGHIQERFKAAIEHLGSKNESVRIGSFYEFFRLASDNKKLRRNIFDILRAHLRRVTTNHNYRVRVIKNKRTTEEVEGLLNVLFRSKDSEEEFIFAGYSLLNLREIFLVRANLYKAYLRDAKMWRVDLQGADLREADLQSADLREADLRQVNLRDGDLRGAYLYKIDLRGANMQGMKLQGVKLQRADLRRADLRGGNLQGAKLQSANLQQADLRKVDFGDADLQDADLQEANLQGVDLKRVKNLETADLRKAEIEGTEFPEGYDPPDDEIVDEDEDRNGDEYEYDDDSS